MSLLLSKIQPLIYDNETFAEVFRELLNSSDQVKIATGYISQESVMELQSMLSYYLIEGRKKECDLTIGMHYREGFTRPQYEAARSLANFLEKNNLGTVRLCTAFKFHGKFFSFYEKTTPTASIMGSSNLSNLMEPRQWEVDYLFNGDSAYAETLAYLDRLYEGLVSKATKKLLELPEIFKFLQKEDLLEGRTGVKKITPQEVNDCRQQICGPIFELPLKAEEKSNLNVFFGKGRAAPNGAVRPRPWYEVEVIVPVSISRENGYPESHTQFNVITDDGWNFRCKISGQNDKNFRSEDDLQTLGRWIKGRLEASGLLQVGKPITENMLNEYGRKTLSFSKTNIPDTWFLDFST